MLVILFVVVVIEAEGRTGGLRRQSSCSGVIAW
jgi:hypothetical protein